MTGNTYSFATSGAFAEAFCLKPHRSGLLDGLSFAVKDNIDIAGYKTSFGSHAWRAVHQEATCHALCIDQLIGAGATCVGKSIADEYTYSLEGQSYFYGTPINPKVPDRIPGGSSSGSASAVACRIVDFSIGTDAAGSIRVPASFCGMRPTLHRISEAGVMPFMPSVSTVGAFSNDIDTLEKVMHTLLRSQPSQVEDIRNIYLLEDAFLLADVNVSNAVRSCIHRVCEKAGLTTRSVFLSDIVGENIDLSTCNTDALRVLQSAEFMNTVGGWVEIFSPEKGPCFSAAYDRVRNFDRTGINDALKECEKLYTKILSFTQRSDLFLYPTTPTIAPLKDSLNNTEGVADFYDRTMAITSFAGVGRMPEISIPLIVINGAPVGLSVAAGHYRDEFLLASAKRLFSQKIVGF